MEAYTSTLTLLTESLTDPLSCPHNALLSHLKLIPGFHACYILTHVVYDLNTLM